MCDRCSVHCGARRRRSAMNSHFYSTLGEVIGDEGQGG